MSKGFWITLGLILIGGVAFVALTPDDLKLQALAIIGAVLGPVFLIALAVWVVRTGIRAGMADRERDHRR